MANRYKVVNPQSFLSYAGKRRNVWKTIIDQPVMHCQYGNGLIADVCGDTPIIWVYFENEEGKLEKKRFTPEAFDGQRFTKMKVTTELAQEIALNEQRQNQQRLKLEERERQAKAQRAIIEHVREATRQALANNFDVTVSTPDLNAQDIQLALLWSDSPELRQEITPDNVDEKVVYGEYSKHWELGRVLSARAAEKAVANFYQRYGYTVRDISITQIAQEGSLDWKDCDLMVDGDALDVKNSRTSAKNKQNYVEHCVPQFKHSRTNQQVKIAGVLSSYLHACSLVNPDTTPDHWQTTIRFLGLVTLATINSLKHEFEIPGVFHIELERPGRGSSQFLPPWVFDYPKFLYKKRDYAFCDIARQPVLEFSAWEEHGTNPIPIYLAVGVDLLEEWKRDSLLSWEWDFIARLATWRTRRDLSLPFLYATVLTHFLQMVRLPTLDPDYRPMHYIRLLYYEGNYTKPLFTYDPLETIHNLIKTLDILWEAEHSLVRQFRVFKLQGLNILRGRFDSDDAQWKTLIAYCGGWTPDKKRCDNNPLVLGICDHCPECGKLICPECGFCSGNCSLYHKRLSEFANQANMVKQPLSMSSGTMYLRS
ncbi:MAG: hypothetical protein JXA21_25480 [Anaerolineae bacterium]|nr:hypothetical protein [Anaerolineae bacterium]